MEGQEGSKVIFEGYIEATITADSWLKTPMGQTSTASVSDDSAFLSTWPIYVLRLQLLLLDRRVS
jgi:hypothetical protein